MATNNTHHSLLKILFSVFLFLVVASGLAAAVVMSRQTQSVASQASVKSGIVTVTLVNQTKTPTQNQQVKVDIKADSNKALIQSATLGIRFKGGDVKNVTFTPVMQGFLKQSTQFKDSATGDSGINLSFLSPLSRPIAIPNSTIGTLTFVPTTSGQLTISFDPNYSHVPLLKTRPKPPVPHQPTKTTGTATTGTSANASPQVTAAPMAQDLLQTPISLTLNVVSAVGSHVPSPVPTGSPAIKCGVNDSCPNGYQCYQPPMPPCPKGLLCAQVMPSKECRHVAVPSPSTICAADKDCPAGYSCTQPPMPRCPNGMMCAQVMPPAQCTPKYPSPTSMPLRY
ncbi:hypothetical protein BH10PAT2_BH10PAT2_0520 [soil metagenome]